MDDRTMLELAAKAAGISWMRCWYPDAITKQSTEALFVDDRIWNPLTDDGDEARLEAALELHVEWLSGLERVAVVRAPSVYCVELYGKDRQQARRRAGVRAAAEIGKAMP